jgi:hypothetical protein
MWPFLSGHPVNGCGRLPFAVGGRFTCCSNGFGVASTGAVLSSLNIKHVKGLFTAKDAPPAVIVEDAALVPPQYIRMTESVDKTAVKAALARGVQIAGVRLVQGVSLQRKRG